MSFALSVPQHVARNPVARAIERTRLRKFKAETLAEIRALKTWDHAPSLLCGVAEAIAIAAKTIEGWDDPDAIGDVLVDAINAIREMSEAGFVWREKHQALVCEAFDAAMQIIDGQDPRAKVKAWQWSQQIIAAEMAAREQA